MPGATSAHPAVLNTIKDFTNTSENESSACTAGIYKPQSRKPDPSFRVRVAVRVLSEIPCRRDAAADL